MAHKADYPILLTVIKKTSAFVLLLSLIGCNVQKRKYQKGYYIDWAVNTNKEVNTTTLSHPKTKAAPIAHKTKPVRVQDKSMETASTELAVTADNTSARKNISRSQRLNRANDTCDRLLKKNGDEIACKVKEISTTEIVYKRCDMANGPDYRIRKSEVLMVTYANGLKEKFEGSSAGASPFESEKPVQKVTKRDNDYALYSMICGVAGFVLGIGSIPAIVLGILALRQIDRNPDKYEGRSMAVLGIVLGVLKLLLIALVIALIFML